MHIRPPLVRFDLVMKNRIIASALAAFVAALTASACEGGHHRHDRDERDRLEQVCKQYASCQACTPVSGCGWCQTGVGQGTCAADPDECAGAAAFSWTWNPSGCVAAPATPDRGASAIPDAGGATTASPSPDRGEDAAVDAGTDQ
jgi:hypothetical protein